MMLRRATHAAAALLLALLCAPSPPASAHAAGAASASASQLLVSYDGETWHDDLPALFEPTPIVPGDRLSRTVFVRNASEDPATLTVVAADVELYSASAQPFYDELALSVGESDSESVAVPFSALTDAVLYDSSLDPAQTVALDVAVSFPHEATSGSEAAEDHAAFALRMTLADSEATIPSGDEDSDVTLPGTGGTVVGLWWGVVAIVAGTVAAVFDRRRAATRRERLDRLPTTRP